MVMRRHTLQLVERRERLVDVKSLTLTVHLKPIGHALSIGHARTSADRSPSWERLLLRSGIAWRDLKYCIVEDTIKTHHLQCKKARCLFTLKTHTCTNALLIYLTCRQTTAWARGGLLKYYYYYYWVYYYYIIDIRNNNENITCDKRW